MAEIKNKKTGVSNTVPMNDMDLLNDLLLSFKLLVDNYAISLNEASNEELYKDYFTLFKEVSLMQAKIFKLAFQKGWYSLEEAEQIKITKKYDEYNKRKTEFNIK